MSKSHRFTTLALVTCLLSMPTFAIAQDADPCVQAPRKAGGLSRLFSAAKRAGLGDMLVSNAGGMLGSGRNSQLIGAVAKTALEAADNGHADTGAVAGAVGDAVGKPREAQMAGALIGGLAQPSDDASQPGDRAVRCARG